MSERVGLLEAFERRRFHPEQATGVFGDFVAAARQVIAEIVGSGGHVLRERGDYAADDIIDMDAAEHLIGQVNPAALSPPAPGPMRCAPARRCRAIGIPARRG